MGSLSRPDTMLVFASSLPWSFIIKYRAAFLLCLFPLLTSAADLTVRLQNAPDAGSLVFQVYDSADTFGDFRDPATEVVLPSTGDGEYQLSGIVEGQIALLVYFDENANGRIDKNFIGIPRERLALSNNYQPKGPPSFSRASFDAQAAANGALDMEMYDLLGKRGRFGVGIGAIGRSSPYRGSSESVVRVIPAITYVGERLQWFGPALRYGLAGSGKLRFAATAEYRIASYEESDSDVLIGLGDREDTLMAGLGLQYEIAKGFELEVGYQHDVLDRIGGGLASARLSRAVRAGSATFVPGVAYNWLGSDISNHDFGVPGSAATVDRPGYAPGSTTSLEVGLRTFIELSEEWNLLINLSGEKFDSDVTASPIVSDDVVIKGLAIISYLF